MENPDSSKSVSTSEIGAAWGTTVWDQWVARLLPLLTALVAVGGFLFGIYQFGAQRRDADEAERNRRAEADRLRALEILRESAKPFWDKQVQLYLDAAEAAATIAASDDTDMVKKARNRFWTLYWGSLSAVEDVGLNRKRPGDKQTPIESAMVELGKRISGEVKCERAELQQHVLRLSHAIRDAIRPAFAGDAVTPSTILGLVDKDMSQVENP